MKYICIYFLKYFVSLVWGYLCIIENKFAYIIFINYDNIIVWCFSCDFYYLSVFFKTPILTPNINKFSFVVIEFKPLSF